ncbi:hypothetical protein J5X84_20125 [Streptosporangiaceae bacterium NEAU-GS5]|nr:hypothetical protein [Streptosporangiaceae bacterium NEAU-GS5]
MLIIYQGRRSGNHRVEPGLSSLEISGRMVADGSGRGAGAGDGLALVSRPRVDCLNAIFSALGRAVAASREHRHRPAVHAHRFQ